MNKQRTSQRKLALERVTVVSLQRETLATVQGGDSWFRTSVPTFLTPHTPPTWGC